MKIENVDERSSMEAVNDMTDKSFGCSSCKLVMNCPAAFGDLSGPQLYSSGTELLRQDSRAGAVHLIRAGLVKLVHVTAEGKTMIAALRTAGSLLGAVDVVLETPSPITATTVVPTSLCRIGTRKFMELLATDIRFCEWIIKTISMEARGATIQAIEAGSYPARDRLMRLLSHFAADTARTDKSEWVRLQLPVRYGELAQLATITPAYLCRLLARMERSGVIRRNKGWIRIARSVLESP